MRKYIFIVLLFSLNTLHAQYINRDAYTQWMGRMGVGKSTQADASAWLELGESGTGKSLILPRLNGNATIVTPREGMFHYDLGTKKLYYYNGASWMSVMDNSYVPPSSFTNADFDTRLATKTTDNLAQGVANLYWSQSLFNTAFSAKTTDNLAEGATNLYWTPSRFDTRLATKTTDNLTEGATNLYFTNARAVAAVGTNFIQNQIASQQSASFWVNNAKVGGSLTLLNALQHATLSTDPTGANGQMYYNSTSNKFKGYLSSAWDNLASESWVNGQIRTGNYVYVDANNPNSTDSRGLLSKYSITTPFKTISAAVSAWTNGDVIYVRAGTYNENVSINSQSTVNVILDNCTVNGGTGNAFFVTGAGQFTVNIYMVNAVITNTGDAANLQSKAAFYSNICNVSIYGNSRFTCKINSTNSSGLYNNQGGSSDPIYLDNITVSSTNTYAYYDTGIAGSVTACAFTSTNSSAMNASQYVVDRCTFTGYTSAISSGGFLGLSTITNSTFTSSNGTGFNAPGLIVGGVAVANVFRISNCTFNTYAEPIAPQGANASVGYNFSVENCKFLVSHATTIFNLVTATGGASAHSVKLLNAISNVPAFSSSFRATDAAYINESNTSSGNTINFGINVGFGSATPTSAVDITGSNGYSQFRLRTQYTPSSSSDANGNTGDFAADDNYLYYKKSSGTWVRTAWSTF